MSKLQLLKNGFLFQNFTESELQSLSEFVLERWVATGMQIFLEGAQADSIFLIQAGKVEIQKEGADGTKLVVARLGEGAHFGEMAFVDRAPRAASATALENLKLLEIRYADLEKVVATQPVVGLKLYHSIAKTLCARIRQTTSDLSSLFLP